MISTLGINDSQPRNLEAPRSPDLLPEQIRVTATNFLMLLTEYYKYMNINAWTTSSVTLNTYTLSTTTGTVLAGKSGSGPSNIIYSILAELDPDQVDADYLAHIQNTIAPYVPIPTYMSSTSTVPTYNRLKLPELFAGPRAALYQKIVKYFYNVRGSRNSVPAFFLAFYNDTASILDANDLSSQDIIQSQYIKPWLTASGMAIAATTVKGGSAVYGQTPIQAWTPFSYIIQTSVANSTFEKAYRALVHPIGFKYHVQTILANNGIVEVSDSRMVNARLDYQNALWFLDSTPLSQFVNFIIKEADGAYNEANQNTATYTYADWSNIGAVNQFNVLTTATASSATYTLSVGTYSILNIVPGMIVTGTSSFGTTSSAIVNYSSSSVNTISGTVTLLTTLSSTINSGSTITFSPDAYKYP